jgi:hypothetical protein
MSRPPLHPSSSALSASVKKGPNFLLGDVFLDCQLHPFHLFQTYPLCHKLFSFNIKSPHESRTLSIYERIIFHPVLMQMANACHSLHQCLTRKMCLIPEGCPPHSHALHLLFTAQSLSQPQSGPLVCNSSSNHLTKISSALLMAKSSLWWFHTLLVFSEDIWCWFFFLLRPSPYVATQPSILILFQFLDDSFQSALLCLVLYLPLIPTPMSFLLM